MSSRKGQIVNNFDKATYDNTEKSDQLTEKRKQELINKLKDYNAEELRKEMNQKEQK